MVRDQDHYLPAVGSIPAITDISSPSSPFTQYRCHGLWYIAVLSIPAVLFVVYLGFHLKRNIKKLNRRRSHVMIAYYALLWLSAILNLAWCSLQVWQCIPGKEVFLELIVIADINGNTVFRD